MTEITKETSEEEDENSYKRGPKTSVDTIDVTADEDIEIQGGDKPKRTPIDVPPLIKSLTDEFNDTTDLDLRKQQVLKSVTNEYGASMSVDGAPMPVESYPPKRQSTETIADNVRCGDDLNYMEKEWVSTEDYVAKRIEEKKKKYY